MCRPEIIRTIALVAFLSLLCSCSALRHVRTTGEVDSTAVDRSVITVRDTVTQIVNQVVTQTVVEYYPVYDTVYVSGSHDVVADSLPETDPAFCRTVRAQPVKSVTRTEIRTGAVAMAGQDSVICRDVATEVESTTETRQGQSSAAVILKWSAILVIWLALLLIIIKMLFLRK